MHEDRDARFRKVVSGMALLLAAPLSMVSWVLVPTSMVEGSTFVTEIASTDSGRSWVSMVTGVMFFPVAIVAVLGLLHLLTGRERLVGTLGGGLAIVGLSLNVVAFGAAGTLTQAVYSGVDPTVTANLVEDTMTGPTGVVALMGVLLGILGTTLLGIALYRGRVVPRVWALMLVAYGPLQLAGFGGEVIAVITLSYAVMAAGMIPIGIHLLRESLDEWRHPAMAWDGSRLGEEKPTALVTR